MKQLILGGARSGKSSEAERRGIELANQKSKTLVYVATAEAGDAEMTRRIEHHRVERDPRWRTIEEPLKLARVLNNYSDNYYCILIDCLTLWLSNCLHHNQWETERDQFIHALKQSQADVLLVSNEVGSGIVPMGELSRTFVDEAGWLHQDMAKICKEVTLVVAGLPMKLK